MTKQERAPAILFDQFSRYESCAEILRENGARTVLDVGSGPFRLLGDRLPEAAVTYLDPQHVADTGDDVLAGGFERLSLTDRKFDFVVAIDTLEHIPRADRAAFLDAMIDHAELGVVLSGPVSEDTVAKETDDAVSRAYRAMTGADYPWLAEHEEFGLPQLATARSTFESAGFRTAIAGNGHAPWLRLLLPLFVCVLEEQASLGPLQDLSALFNHHLYPFDHLEPTYRRVLVGRRDQDPRMPRRDATREEARVAWDRFWAEFVARIGRVAQTTVEVGREIDERLRELEDCVEAGEARLARLEKERDEARAAGTTALAERDAVDAELAAMRASLSWRLTTGLRWLGRLGRGS